MAPWKINENIWPKTKLISQIVWSLINWTPREKSSLKLHLKNFKDIKSMISMKNKFSRWNEGSKLLEFSTGLDQFQRNLLAYLFSVPSFCVILIHHVVRIRSICPYTIGASNTTFILNNFLIYVGISRANSLRIGID